MHVAKTMAGALIYPSIHTSRDVYIIRQWVDPGRQKGACTSVWGPIVG